MAGRDVGSILAGVSTCRVASTGRMGAAGTRVAAGMAARVATAPLGSSNGAKRQRRDQDQSFLHVGIPSHADVGAGQC